MAKISPAARRKANQRLRGRLGMQLTPDRNLTPQQLKRQNIRMRGRLPGQDGSGRIGRPMFPGGPNRPAFPGGGQSGNGYQGVDDIVNFLSQGINESQFNNLAQGHTGVGGYNVGNADGGRSPHGLFQGLSPYAVHYLTNSGLLEKQAPELLPTEGLEGDDLFRNELMNTLRGQQPGSYKLRGGIDADFLEQVFAMNPMGQSAYAAGYNAEGAIPKKVKPFKPQPRKGRLGPLKQKNRNRRGMRTGPSRPGGPYW